MKKLFLLIAASFMVAATVNAQTTAASLRREIKLDKKDGKKMEKKEERKALRKLEGSEVSYQSKQAFEGDFNHITPISSKRLDNFDEFTFTNKKGITKSAYYDGDSKLVGTVEDKTFADLPVKGREYISKHFSDYTPGDVIFYDDNEFNETDMIIYGLQFADQDSYFVELKKPGEKIVLQILKDGDVIFFTQLT
ncbi:MAG: hypothetical protein ABI288_09465 [Ginsengibacter sp.]